MDAKRILFIAQEIFPYRDDLSEFATRNTGTGAGNKDFHAKIWKH